MTVPARKHTPPLLTEIRRLHSEGFSLIPLEGEDGKRPAVKFGGNRRLPFDIIMLRIDEAAASSYGIRLPDLAVIDIDDPSPELVERIKIRFGRTPVQTRTPNGRHLFYRMEQKCPINLRSEGLPIDVKSGENSYVVGPYSRRADGTCYLPEGEPLTRSALPEINLGNDSAGSSPPVVVTQAGPCLVPEGERHDYLFKAAGDLISKVASQQELEGRLEQIRDQKCANPSSVDHAEIAAIADWWWRKRCANSIFGGRNSEFPISRHALDLLQGDPDSMALYVTLVAAHGHQPGKNFGLAQKAMTHANLVISRDRFTRARDTLLRIGLLEVAAPHIRGKRRRQYCLCRPS